MNKIISNTLNNTDHLLIQSIHKEPIDLNTNNGSQVRMNIIGEAYNEGKSITRQKHELLERLIGR